MRYLKGSELWRDFRDRAGNYRADWTSTYTVNLRRLCVRSWSRFGSVRFGQPVRTDVRRYGSVMPTFREPCDQVDLRESEDMRARKRVAGAKVWAGVLTWAAFPTSPWTLLAYRT